MPGERAPTHEEVAGADSMCEGEEKASAKAAFKEFREKVQGGSSAPGGAFRDELAGESVDVGKGGAWDREPLVLTREERRQMYGGWSRVRDTQAWMLIKISRTELAPR